MDHKGDAGVLVKGKALLKAIYDHRQKMEVENAELGLVRQKVCS